MTVIWIIVAILLVNTICFLLGLYGIIGLILRLAMYYGAYIIYKKYIPLRWK